MVRGRAASVYVEFVSQTDCAHGKLNTEKATVDEGFRKGGILSVGSPLLVSFNAPLIVNSEGYTQALLAVK